MDHASLSLSGAGINLPAQESLKDRIIKDAEKQAFRRAASASRNRPPPQLPPVPVTSASAAAAAETLPPLLEQQPSDSSALELGAAADATEPNAATTDTAPAAAPVPQPPLAAASATTAATATIKPSPPATQRTLPKSTKQHHSTLSLSKVKPPRAGVGFGTAGGRQPSHGAGGPIGHRMPNTGGGVNPSASSPALTKKQAAAATLALAERLLPEDDRFKIPAVVNVRLAQMLKNAKPLFRFEESTPPPPAAAPKPNSTAAAGGGVVSVASSTFITAPTSEITIGRAPITNIAAILANVAATAAAAVPAPESGAAAATAAAAAATAAADGDADDPNRLPSPPTPYVLQGDREWNTKANRVLRANLRKHPAIGGAIHLFFRLLVKTQLSAVKAKTEQGVTQIDYTRLHLRMAKALDSTFDEKKAIQTAEDEWERDCRDSDRGMTRKEFQRAMFQCVDTWTTGVEADEYIDFLMTLYQRITVPVKDANGAPGEDGADGEAADDAGGDDAAGAETADGAAATARGKKGADGKPVRSKNSPPRDARAGAGAGGRTRNDPSAAAAGGGGGDSSPRGGRRRGRNDGPIAPIAALRTLRALDDIVPVTADNPLGLKRPPPANTIVSRQIIAGSGIREPAAGTESTAGGGPTRAKRMSISAESVIQFLSKYDPKNGGGAGGRRGSGASTIPIDPSDHHSSAGASGDLMSGSSDRLTIDPTSASRSRHASGSRPVAGMGSATTPMGSTAGDRRRSVTGAGSSGYPLSPLAAGAVVSAGTDISMSSGGTSNAVSATGGGDSGVAGLDAQPMTVAPVVYSVKQQNHAATIIQRFMLRNKWKFKNADWRRRLLLPLFHRSHDAAYRDQKKLAVLLGRSGAAAYAKRISGPESTPDGVREGYSTAVGQHHAYKHRVAGTKHVLHQNVYEPRIQPSFQSGAPARRPFVPSGRSLKVNLTSRYWVGISKLLACARFAQKLLAAIGRRRMITDLVLVLSASGAFSYRDEMRRKREVRRRRAQEKIWAVKSLLTHNRYQYAARFVHNLLDKTKSAYVDYPPTALFRLRSRLNESAISLALSDAENPEIRATREANELKSEHLALQRHLQTMMDAAAAKDAAANGGRTAAGATVAAGSTIVIEPSVRPARTGPAASPPLTAMPIPAGREQPLPPINQIRMHPHAHRTSLSIPGIATGALAVSCIGQKSPTAASRRLSGNNMALLSNASLAAMRFEGGSSSPMPDGADGDFLDFSAPAGIPRRSSLNAGAGGLTGATLGVPGIGGSSNRGGAKRRGSHATLMQHPTATLPDAIKKMAWSKRVVTLIDRYQYSARFLHQIVDKTIARAGASTYRAGGIKPIKAPIPALIALRNRMNEVLMSVTLGHFLPISVGGSHQQAAVLHQRRPSVSNSSVPRRRPSILVGGGGGGAPKSGATDDADDTGDAPAITITGPTMAMEVGGQSLGSRPKRLSGGGSAGGSASGKSGETDDSNESAASSNAANPNATPQQRRTGSISIAGAGAARRRTAWSYRYKTVLHRFQFGARFLHNLIDSLIVHVMQPDGDDPRLANTTPNSPIVTAALRLARFTQRSSELAITNQLRAAMLRSPLQQRRNSGAFLESPNSNRAAAKGSAASAADDAKDGGLRVRRIGGGSSPVKPASGANSLDDYHAPHLHGGALPALSPAARPHRHFDSSSGRVIGVVHTTRRRPAQHESDDPSADAQLDAKQDASGRSPAHTRPVRVAVRTHAGGDGHKILYHPMVHHAERLAAAQMHARHFHPHAAHPHHATTAAVAGHHALVQSHHHPSIARAARHASGLTLVGRVMKPTTDGHDNDLEDEPVPHPFGADGGDGLNGPIANTIARRRRRRERRQRKRELARERARLAAAAKAAAILAAASGSSGGAAPMHIVSFGGGGARRVVHHASELLGSPPAPTAATVSGSQTERARIKSDETKSPLVQPADAAATPLFSSASALSLDAESEASSAASAQFAVDMVKRRAGAGGELAIGSSSSAVVLPKISSPMKGLTTRIAAPVVAAPIEIQPASQPQADVPLSARVQPVLHPNAENARSRLLKREAARRKKQEREQQDMLRRLERVNRITSIEGLLGLNPSASVPIGVGAVPPLPLAAVLPSVDPPSVLTELKLETAPIPVKLVTFPVSGASAGGGAGSAAVSGGLSSPRGSMTNLIPLTAAVSVSTPAVVSSELLPQLVAAAVSAKPKSGAVTERIRKPAHQSPIAMIHRASKIDAAAAAAAASALTTSESTAPAIAPALYDFKQSTPAVAPGSTVPLRSLMGSFTERASPAKQKVQSAIYVPSPPAATAAPASVTHAFGSPEAGANAKPKVYRRPTGRRANSHGGGGGGSIAGAASLNPIAISRVLPRVPAPLS